MAIEIQETFRVQAPIATVWRFMMTPENVAECMPGASLVEVVDERTFIGNIKLKVGAVSASYQGRISFTDVDEASHGIEMHAEAKEPGGGTVNGTVSSRMTSLGEGETEVLCEANIEITGRVMQVGRGMIQGVSQQLFKKFVANTQKRLEADAVSAGESVLVAAGPTAVRSADADDSIAIVPLLLQTFWSWLKGLFGRA